ncbi:unnamed protein product [Schistosoma mattheei]|uniref:Uncharacterized protein n=1 Tax=Schistosoma mattheei TaxID=31246 RepID=A0A183PS17_9TREM|nr:unnamed protein product [Schistosoma mattheei]
MQLDDLNFADDLSLLSCTRQQMQLKTTSVPETSASIGLNIHKGKSKILKHNTENTKTITLCSEALEEVEIFTYLESIIDEQGGSDIDVKSEIGKKDCPSGLLNRSTFLSMYTQFFPDGKARLFYEHLFRTFDQDASGSIDFNEFLTVSRLIN